MRLLVVLGAQPQIDTALRERGVTPQFLGGYRVTSAEALEAAVEAAGRSRTAAEQYLSKGPSVPVFRRHSKSDGEMHFGPALNVVSGNYVAAKRRGIVDGIDYGFTGCVLFLRVFVCVVWVSCACVAAAAAACVPLHGARTFDAAAPLHSNKHINPPPK